MQDQATTATTHRTMTISAAASKVLQLAAAFMLGAVMVYGAGFVETAEVHNAAHDMRHSQSFPCH